MDKHYLIKALELEPHTEGGYYRRTFGSEQSITKSDASQRPIMSSIYYLLTDDSPIGYFHRNQSDIVHYWHSGNSLKYLLIGPEGQFETFILGPNIEAGEQLQMLVAGGYWKATQLIMDTTTSNYGLLSEAVAPGFDYADMSLASASQMAKDFPTLWNKTNYNLAKFCKH
jgi:predicted cupin superfamily sugar epimerase